MQYIQVNVIFIHKKNVFIIPHNHWYEASVIGSHSKDYPMLIVASYENHSTEDLWYNPASHDEKRQSVRKYKVNLFQSCMSSALLLWCLSVLALVICVSVTYSLVHIGVQRSRSLRLCCARQRYVAERIARLILGSNTKCLSSTDLEN